MTAVLIVLGALIGLFVFWRFFFFFRNPDRKIVVNDDHILSPADGRVIYLRRVTNDSNEPIMSIKGRKVIELTDLMHVDDDALVGKTGYLIGIFMGPFDVHYNRAPVRGHMRKIAHDFPRSSLGDKINQGMFNGVSNLYFGEEPYHHDCDFIVDNERTSYVITNERQSVYVTQIAEKWIRRIVCFKDDENVRQGEVFGLIRMGSQVDIFVPDCDEYEVLVDEGSRVKAGLTVLLKRKGSPTVEYVEG